MAERDNRSLHIETQLSRDLGLMSALAIGVGTMIAAGIFTLSGLAVRNVGSAAIVSFLLAAVVAMFTALTYCEFVSIYPQSGEGYLYARKTYPPPLAYFVGWALFLGYASSCAFYIASFSSYFHEFIWKTPIESMAGIIALIALILLNIKGTKESGTFQIVITIAKVMLLIWFIAGGVGRVDGTVFMEKLSTDVVKIGSTAALVFITFFGFSAIAASAGEVRNAAKTVPRAIFISMGVVTVLYSLVVLVMIAASLSEYSEAAMGTAARMFLGPIGGMVIVAGALFSMISASNASIMAGSRVTMAMSHLGHFPKGFGTVSARTRTPIVALVLVGGAILLFAVALPLEDLAHYADTVLLLVLIFVNAALIVHRRKYPGIERPFRVPLVPLLPIMGILANLYLLAQILRHPLPMAMAGGSLVLGMAAFLSWKGMAPVEGAIPGVASHVVLERTAVTAARFRVLVPLANPKNIERLMEIAASIASERNGEIVALRVALVPEQTSPDEWDEDYHVKRERKSLEIAHEAAKKLGVPVTSLVRIGHHAARAILETARERDCDLIVLGWRGRTTTARKVLGEVVDAVVSHARSHVMLVKLAGNKPMRKFLLPTAGGEHARLAEEYTASMIRVLGGSMTVCAVRTRKGGGESTKDIERRLAETVERIKGNDVQEVDSELIRSTSVRRGILDASKQYDAVVIGAAGRSTYAQMLFGRIPEFVARETKCPVILVKRYHPVKALFRRVMDETT